MLVEDVDDFDVDDDFGGSSSAGITPRGAAYGSSMGGRSSSMQGTPLAPDAARAVTALLWGPHGQPPPSWKQGFYFSTVPGLRFGLVQREGGPCGVLASVQAHVISHLMAPSHTNLDPRAPEQQAALANALADCIWQARVGPVAQLAVAAGEAGVSPAMMPYDQLMHCVVLQQASSREQLQALCAAALGCYMDTGGWGCVLLLLSVLLSRGLDNVRGDMDEQGTALMGMHGYCTQELVNLLLTGQAVSNVFDGQRELDGSMLHGITRTCRLGFLTLFEWYQYVAVGHSLKSPQLPIWVVCSESHFTVLFSQDTKCLHGALPFDLLYYDELAQQQEVIRLTVRHDPEGGWTAKVGDSFADRGKCEGQHIPPLECVIETRWPGVHVDWNGSEPIL